MDNKENQNVNRFSDTRNASGRMSSGAEIAALKEHVDLRRNDIINKLSNECMVLRDGQSALNRNVNESVRKLVGGIETFYSEFKLFTQRISQICDRILFQTEENYRALEKKIGLQQIEMQDRINAMTAKLSEQIERVPRMVLDARTESATPVYRPELNSIQRDSLLNVLTERIEDLGKAMESTFDRLDARINDIAAMKEETFNYEAMSDRVAQKIGEPTVDYDILAAKVSEHFADYRSGRDEAIVQNILSGVRTEAINYDLLAEKVLEKLNRNERGNQLDVDEIAAKTAERIVLPEVKVPEVNVDEIATKTAERIVLPEVKVPEVNTDEIASKVVIPTYDYEAVAMMTADLIKVPEVHIPEVNVDEIAAKTAERIVLPEVKVPEVNVEEIATKTAERIVLPEVKVPEVNTDEIASKVIVPTIDTDALVEKITAVLAAQNTAEPIDEDGLAEKLADCVTRLYDEDEDAYSILIDDEGSRKIAESIAEKLAGLLKS